jgi:class 3 adenylate cyclase/tetratricopeptide (TPR) repeat protein
MVSSAGFSGQPSGKLPGTFEAAVTADITISCVHCGFALGPAARFCAGCGRPKALPSAFGHHARTFLQSSVPPSLARHIQRSGNAMLGERKHVTVLFADILDSTAMIDGLDPEEALDVLAPTLRLLMDAVHRFDGFVNQTLGDGIMALFGAPIASEDHAVQACRAALAMQEAVREHNLAGGGDIGLRIGLNSGQVVIHSIGSNLAMNYDAVGKTVHLAARMEDLAERNGIVLSEATRRLADGFVTVRPRGLAKVKGVAEPVETFDLTEVRRRTRWQVRSSRGLSRLVGRRSDLRGLEAAVARTAAGEGGALALTGEAGLGKSRLVHDFLGRLPDDWTVFETACVAHGVSSSYHPVSALIRDMIGARPTDTPAETTAKAAALLQRFDPGLADLLPAILSLLDVESRDAAWTRLEPTERRNKVTEALKAIAFRQAGRSPLLMLVEDVHWIDAETRLILRSIAAEVKGRRILLLVTQRPGAASLGPAVQRIDLPALDPVMSRDLLDWLMGRDASLAALKKSLLDQAQGNPLFIEELVQALRDQGILEGAPGRYRLAAAAAGTRIDVPPTIASVLAARIDLLDGLPKTLLQTAAVVGTSVAVEVLAEMVELLPQDLGGQLDVLEQADFLHREDSSRRIFRFKHELTREVAYGSMLLGLRRSLHAKALAIIERRFADRLNEHVDRLADHAFRAELWDKALPYLLRSCRRALKRGAYFDAIALYERGLETLAHWPPSAERTTAEIDLRLTVIIALEPLGRHRQIASVLREAAALAEGSTDLVRVTAVGCQLATALWRLGEHDAAMPVASAAMANALQVKIPALTFAALHAIGIIHHERGDYAKAIALHEQCYAYESPELDAKRAGWAGYPTVILRTFIADSLVEIGDYDRAMAVATEAARTADGADHAYSRANINHVRGRLLTALGRPQEAIALLRPTWQSCLELEMLQMYPVFAARMGEAYLAMGDVAAALEILSAPERLDVPLAEHAFGWRYLFVAQGHALLRAGRLDEARQAGERALTLAIQRTEPPQEAYALKLLGDVAAGGGSEAEAAALYRRAHALAEGCAMRPLLAACRDAEQRLSRRA